MSWWLRPRSHFDNKGRMKSMAKLKQLSWHQRTRTERAANVMFPHLSDEETKKQMATLSRNENKQAPSGAKLLSDKERGFLSPLGGKAR
jgi:hypothetical protein